MNAVSTHEPQRPLRVGILGHDFVNWAGGLDYLRLMCSTLNASGVPVELHFLLPDRGPKAWVLLQAKRLLGAWRRRRGRLSGLDFAPSRALILAAVSDSVGQVQVHRLDLGHGPLRRIAKRLSLDALLPAIQPLPADIGVPWVAHIYDFQHRHLPHYFNAAESQARDLTFSRLLQEAPVVVFNAAAVMADAQRFLPPARAQLVKLPLSAAPVGAWFETDVAQTQARYGLDQPYFIVCNQFWLHKDHQTAFNAFARLALETPEPCLVCTGSTSDPRNPRHLQELVQALQAQGVAARVRILGLIPKQDQIALLRGALALVQPTLCEGTPGGLAAYDAVSLGVPVLASDIAVNLELKEAGVSFFKAGDAASLHALMRARWQAGAAPAAEPSALLQRGRERQAAFGRAVVHSIQLARGQR